MLKLEKKITFTEYVPVEGGLETSPSMSPFSISPGISPPRQAEAPIIPYCI